MKEQELKQFAVEFQKWLQDNVMISYKGIEDSLEELADAFIEQWNTRQPQNEVQCSGCNGEKVHYIEHEGLETNCLNCNGTGIQSSECSQEFFDGMMDILEDKPTEQANEVTQCGLCKGENWIITNNVMTGKPCPNCGCGSEPIEPVKEVGENDIVGKMVFMNVDYDIMDEIEKRLLEHTGSNPIFRKLLSSKEIKTANRLVKEGKMQKGIADDGSGLVIYYAT